MKKYKVCFIAQFGFTRTIIAERITFDNIEAVYDSGWRVD